MNQTSESSTGVLETNLDAEALEAEAAEEAALLAKKGKLPQALSVSHMGGSTPNVVQGAAAAGAEAIRVQYTISRLTASKHFLVCNISGGPYRRPQHCPPFRGPRFVGREREGGRWRQEEIERQFQVHLM